ncbi:hypothetical protein PHK61_26585 [Actinomycetospora lutea]|uniref:hypothetical protein n=1 Tax=Actinomycetospora lutea TaxID=663604 RepID=UPI0023656F53|nr:hypothetical protein [Actinomycetospora lutea]MDD7941988.1 hypothetical protein [Actinomycetospora lutea]
MSSGTEQRPHTTGPAPLAEETNAAMPRPTGPWTPPQRAPFPPPAAAWAPPPAWSLPPAGLGPHPPGVPAPPARSGTRWGWIVLGIVAAIAAVVLIGTVAANNRTMTVNGTVTIYGMSGYVTPGSGCTGTVASGMPVTLYDASGSVVGTATLTGSGIAANTWSTYTSGYADSCSYAFTMTDVAATDDHYRVKAGSASGDGVGFSREQLETSGAHVTYR